MRSYQVAVQVGSPTGKAFVLIPEAIQRFDTRLRLFLDIQLKAVLGFDPYVRASIEMK